MISGYEPITAGELELLRADYAETLSQTARAVKAIRTGDGGGGSKRAPQDLGSFPCRLRKLRQPKQMQEIGAKSSASVEWTASLPWGARAVVARGCLLIVNEQTFRVIATNAGEAFPVALICDCVAG